MGHFYFNDITNLLFGSSPSLNVLTLWSDCNSECIIFLSYAFIGSNFIGFLFLYFFMRKINYATGTIWWAYIIIYSINRIIVRFFRAEDLMLYGFRAPHVVSFIMLLIATIIIIVINKKSGSDR